MRSRLFVAVLVTALGGAGSASALTVPFTEDFAADASGWENASNDPLFWHDAGGPDGSSYVSTTNNYFGYSNPFGAGPVLFRANGSDDASGGAFVGDWPAGGVQAVSAWVYQDTGVDLTFFLRVANAVNFPGAVLNADTAVPSGVWTQITIPIATTVPPCFEETAPCDQVFAAVANFQLGTNAPAALTEIDQAFVLAIDQVSLVPEADAALGAGASLLGLAWVARRGGRR